MAFPLEADRNLLFGVLALQMDFISREALVAAVTEWTRDRARPLDRILVSQGALSESRRGLLESLVSEHLRAHGDDPQQSLAAVNLKNDFIAVTAATAVEATVAPLTRAPDDDVTLAGVNASTSSNGSRFQVIRPHARGGIGLVSVAIDHELNREVALKEIRPEHADDPDSRSRFILEAEVTGRLEHPGVVPVYGLGINAAGRPYYVMRLIKGDSLKEAIERFHREGATALGLAVCSIVSWPSATPWLMATAAGSCTGT